MTPDDHKSNYAFEHEGRVMWKCLVCGLVMGGDPGVPCDTCMVLTRETTNLICQDCGRDWAEEFPTPTCNANTSRVADHADPADLADLAFRRRLLEGFTAALLCRERHARPENAEACAGCREAAADDYGPVVQWLATSTQVMTPASVPPVPNKPKTPLKSFRIPDDTYRAAQAKAAEKGETVSDVVRRALERYVKRA